uniref:Uncharacterized protein n=1 Tax=Magallana gigas TaxID=29159 RepID=A0A8W8IZL7_MAGGI
MLQVREAGREVLEWIKIHRRRGLPGRQCSPTRWKRTIFQTASQKLSRRKRKRRKITKSQSLMTETFMFLTRSILEEYAASLTKEECFILTLVNRSIHLLDQALDGNLSINHSGTQHVKQSEKLDEKDLGVDKDSQETGTFGETAWPNKMEEDNISNSQSKVVTEEMEEEEEYEITEFDD